MKGECNMIDGNVDPNQPIYNPSNNRPEVLVIEYDGFIKNITEGVLRTMLRDVDNWVTKYPLLNDFVELDQYEIYDTTLLFSPIDFLSYLSDGVRLEKEIEDDLKVIRPDVLIDLQIITSFEYAIHKTLEEPFVQRCYIIKSDPFYENELDYIRKAFNNVSSKVKLAQASIYPFVKKSDVTSIFTTNTKLLLDVIMKEFTDDELKGKLFILSNNMSNLVFNDEEDAYDYLFADEINVLNEKELFGITRMYNLPIDSLDDGEEGDKDDDNVGHGEDDDSELEIKSETITDLSGMNPVG